MSTTILTDEEISSALNSEADKPGHRTMLDYARAIEADRQQRGEPVAWLGVTEDTRYGFKRVEVAQWNPGQLPIGDHPVYTAPQPADPVVKESLTAPAGWQLVPKVLTEEMHRAAVKAIQRCHGNDDFPPTIYAAMLSAAPKFGEEE